MQPADNTPEPVATTIGIDRQELERLIRDSVRLEMSAQQLRKRVTDTYTQQLLATDTKFTEFIQHAITETTHTHRLSTYSFIISYIAALITLLTGIILFFVKKGNSYEFVPGIFIVGGIIWIISLQNRNLDKNNRSLVNNLAKLNIIFAGYTRQIHQVDAIFEDLMGNNQELTSESAEKLLNNLQEAMAEAMNAVTAISVDLEE